MQDCLQFYSNDPPPQRAVNFLHNFIFSFSLISWDYTSLGYNNSSSNKKHKNHSLLLSQDALARIWTNTIIHFFILSSLLLSSLLHLWQPSFLLFKLDNLKLAPFFSLSLFRHFWWLIFSLLPVYYHFHLLPFIVDLISQTRVIFSLILIIFGDLFFSHVLSISCR